MTIAPTPEVCARGNLEMNRVVCWLVLQGNTEYGVVWTGERYRQ